MPSPGPSKRRPKERASEGNGKGGEAADVVPKLSVKNSAELLSDEEQELLEQVGVLLRAKSEKELEATDVHGSSVSSGSGNSASSSASAPAAVRRRLPPLREIPFWNPSHRKMVSLALESDEVRTDLNLLSIEVGLGAQAQTMDGMKGRLRNRSNGTEGAERLQEMNEQTNVSERFAAHPERKGWVTCKQCGVAVWPPNCRKHVAHCR